MRKKIEETEKIGYYALPFQISISSTFVQGTYIQYHDVPTLFQQHGDGKSAFYSGFFLFSFFFILSVSFFFLVLRSFTFSSLFFIELPPSLSFQSIFSHIQDQVDLTPREVVSKLDQYIIGQADAKRAVAIALRNRWRRQRLPQDLIDDVVPKNILMVGPTGSLPFSFDI